MNKPLLLITVLFFTFSVHAQFYDSSFYAARIKSPQDQIIRQVERKMDVFVETFHLKPSYGERFLFFKIDSTGKKIIKWLFTDEKGNPDKMGFTQNSADGIVVYWINMFPENTNYNSYTFVQPILFRTAGIPAYTIQSIPNKYLDSSSIYFDPVIRLPQINIEVNKPRH
jgi:hypothetical protein